MAFTLTEVGGQAIVDKRHFDCDIQADLTEITKKHPILPQGSTAFVIEDGTVWVIKGDNKTWKKL